MRHLLVILAALTFEGGTLQHAEAPEQVEGFRARKALKRPALEEGGTGGTRGGHPYAHQEGHPWRR